MVPVRQLERKNLFPPEKVVFLETRECLHEKDGSVDPEELEMVEACEQWGFVVRTDDKHVVTTLLGLWFERLCDN